MTPTPAEHRIVDLETLAALYGTPGETSVRKETDHLHPLYRSLIEASPFVAVASAGPEGLDVSPRGDAPGFVVAPDAHTLWLPDRRGNNRTDTLRNVLRDPRVALLFLVPGVDETLRVNGRAHLSIAPELLARFEVAGQLPRSVMVVEIDSVYFQCARALVRSALWDSSRHVARDTLPSPGRMLAALTRDEIDGAAYDRALPERLKTSLY